MAELQLARINISRNSLPKQVCLRLDLPLAKNNWDIIAIYLNYKVDIGPVIPITTLILYFLKSKLRASFNAFGNELIQETDNPWANLL